MIEFFKKKTDKGILIVCPSKNLLLRVERSLNLIPRPFFQECTILVSPKKGYAGLTQSRYGLIVFEQGLISEYDKVSIASFIVHEMKHIHQYRRNERLKKANGAIDKTKYPSENSNKGELEALNTQIEFLKLKHAKLSVVEYYEQLRGKNWWDKGSKDYAGDDTPLQKFSKDFIKGRLKFTN